MPRGGVRPGAGRPAKFGVRRRKRMVVLLPEVERWLESLRARHDDPGATLSDVLNEVLLKARRTGLSSED